MSLHKYVAKTCCRMIQFRLGKVKFMCGWVPLPNSSGEAKRGSLLTYNVFYTVSIVIANTQHTTHIVIYCPLFANVLQFLIMVRIAE